jgi:hypothetical protein
MRSCVLRFLLIFLNFLRLLLFLIVVAVMPVLDLTHIQIAAPALRLVLLPILLFSLLSHEYMISEFDSVDALLLLLLLRHVNARVDLNPADPGGFRHGCVDLLQSKLLLYRLFVYVRDHIGRLDERHREARLDQQSRLILQGSVMDRRVEGQFDVPKLAAQSLLDWEGLENDVLTVLKERFIVLRLGLLILEVVSLGLVRLAQLFIKQRPH